MQKPHCRFWKHLLALLAVALLHPALADERVLLAIDGALGPGGAGNYPLDADFSWISHAYPGSTNTHIWTLAAGSDGGIIIDMAQSGQGQISAPRAMYNITSWLLSTATGIHLDPSNNEMDFENMRLSWGEDLYDFGFGTTRSGLVPRVNGPQDAQNANGWWLDGQGKYHLVFRGDGQCAGCTLTVHLTGQMTTSVIGDIAPKGSPDGQLNVADLMRLIRIVGALEMPSEEDLTSADMNNDTLLDLKDVLALSVLLGS